MHGRIQESDIHKIWQREGMDLENVKSQKFSYQAWRRFRKNKLALFGMGFITALVILSVLAPIFTTFDPYVSVKNAAGGLDIYANEDVLLKNGVVSLVHTGLYLQLPFGYEAQIRCRSGLALKHGVMLVNGIGTIDCDYRGEIKIILTNCTPVPYQIKKGDRIAQMVFCKYMQSC
jgi:deoxyuridine 5'-triphosphate nucleotidohydrolase